MRPTVLFLLMLLMIPALAGAAYSLTTRHLIQNIESRQSAFAGALEKYLQQPLRIEGLRGEGRIRHPRLTAHKLRIGNDQALFTADELSIKINLWSSLLHLAPRLTQLSAQNCRLLLRTPYMSAPPDAGALLQKFLPQIADQVGALLLQNCLFSLQVPGKDAHEYRIDLARIRRHEGHYDLTIDAQTQGQRAYAQGWLDYRYGALRKASVYAQAPLSIMLQTLEDAGIILNTAGLQLEDAHGRFWCRHQSGAPPAFQIRLIAAQARFSNIQPPAVIQNLKTEWRAELLEDGDWRAFSPQTQFLLDGRDISFSGDAERRGKELRLRLPEIPLQNALSAVIAFADLPQPLEDAFVGLQPTGRLHDVRVHTPVDALWSRWRLHTQVENLHLIPWDGLPGVSAIDGDLQMQIHEGEFDFRGENFDFHLHPIYTPRRYKKASGVLAWERRDEQWLIDSRDLRITTQGDQFIETQLSLTVPEAADAPAEIDCLLYAPELDFSEALAHVPEETLLELPDWLYKQDHGGSVTEGQVKIQGPLAEELSDQLRVEVQAEFEGVSLQTPLDLRLLGGEGEARYEQERFRADLIFVDSLLGGQSWHESAAQVLADEEHFEIQLSGDGMAGWIGGDTDQIAANLEYLRLPEMEFSELADPEEETWTATVVVRIDELSMNAEPLASDLSFSLLSAPGRMGVRSLNGEYRGIGIIDGILYKETGRDLSNFEGVLSFCDLEEVLTAYACPPEREQRNNRLAVNLSWPGDLTGFELEKSVGNIQASLNEGHFLKLGSFPGQKFLQLLNLDSLLRRLQPSISALTADGMNYEKIRGAVRLQDGMLQIEEDGLVVESNHGRFRLSGVLDMPKRLLDGEIEIMLPISQNLPWYSLLLGGTPAGAAALWLTNQVFDNPLGKMFSVTYKVQGSPEDIRFQTREE